MAIANDRQEGRPPERRAARGRAWARAGDAELHLWGVNAVLELHLAPAPLLLTWTDTDEVMVTAEVVATLLAEAPTEVVHPELIRVGRRRRIGAPDARAGPVVLAALRATPVTDGSGIRWEIVISEEDPVRTVTFSPSDARRLADVLETWLAGTTTGDNRPQ